MCISVRAIVVSVLACLVALAPTPGYSQQPPGTPGGGLSQAAPPASDSLHQETMTGDWNGVRTRWKEKGVDLESSLTQFYQGVIVGRD